MDGPNFSVHGRVALITGAGRGIGLGIAQALAAGGGAVAIQDIELDVAAAEADKINSAGGKAIALGGDVGDLSLLKGFVEETVAKLGGLHILINNAAIQRHCDWMEVTPEEHERTFRVNVTAPMVLCQLAAPIMRQQNWGRIINLSSVNAKGNSRLLPYSMTKSAIDCFTRAMARRLAKEGITINSIAPGWFNTYRNRHEFKTPQDVIEHGKHVPVGRIGEPKDIAGTAVLLCSEAGSYITGQTITVDGGTMGAW